MGSQEVEAMTLKRLDHVNIRTGRLDELRAFYGEFLGLKEGKRPAFSIGGAWLYLGKQACVHLVEVGETPEANTPRVEHFAFMAEGLPDTRARLEAAGHAFREVEVPGCGWTQIFLRDPDGNNVELTFTETGRPL
jgi:catechol 2,3-dioxygenase-like lactoylglutathione lyase family enzyme